MIDHVALRGHLGAETEEINAPIGTDPPGAQKKGTGSADKSETAPKNNTYLLTNTCSAHGAQHRPANFSTREQLELAQERLLLIQDFFIEVAIKDPDCLGQLMQPASKISRAAKEIENILRPKWGKIRRW